jgi:RNA recognition motif-containing protein
VHIAYIFLYLLLLFILPVLHCAIVEVHRSMNIKQQDNSFGQSHIESSNTQPVSRKLLTWCGNIKEHVVGVLLLFINLFKQMFTICTMEKKSKDNKNWDVTLSPIQESTTLLETEAKTPNSERKISAAGRANLTSTQFVERSGEDHVVPHTVVDVHPVEQEIPESVEISFNAPPTPLEQKTEDDELANKLAQIEPAADESKNTLVIKNLPFKYKQTDLDALLEEHHAQPKNVRLLRDSAGRFTGIAFIRCPSKDDAAKLILSMNGLDIQGRSIQVEFKKRKSKKKQQLTTSSNSLTSSGDSDRLSVSSDELVPSRKLAFSDEHGPILPQSILVDTTTAANQPAQPAKRLSISSENNVNEKSFKKQQTPYQQQNLFANFQRRKSMSVVEGNRTLPTNSNVYVNPNRRSLEESNPGFNSQPRSLTSSDSSNNWRSSLNPVGIKPVRQPYGPDGRSNGFSTEYRQSRTGITQ